MKQKDIDKEIEELLKKEKIRQRQELYIIEIEVMLN